MNEAKILPDLRGKTVVVTGANGGLGYASARALACAGASVFLACRSRQKGEEAQRRILADCPHAELHVLELDLKDLSSVAQFVEELERRVSRLDLLMNNAGVMNGCLGVTPDGLELHMATNHLGHFALTGLLLGLLRRTRGSRVVTVSSLAHWAGSIDEGTLSFMRREGDSPFAAYARSKLANLLFAFELQRRLNRQRIDCRSIAAHPGAARTNLGRQVEDTPVMRMLGPLLARVVPDAPEGALSQLRASVDKALEGGEYVGPRGLFGLRGTPGVCAASKASRDEEAAAALWRASERVTGVAYP